MISMLTKQLAPYKLILQLAAVAALAYGVHLFIEHQRDIGRNEVRAEWAQKLQEAKDAAHKREKELIVQRDKAIENANRRDQTILSLAAAARGSGNGLRDTIAAITGAVPNSSADALRATVRAYGDVLGECEGRHREVAEEAERLNSEKKTLIEAWPQNAPAR